MKNLSGLDILVLIVGLSAGLGCGWYFASQRATKSPANAPSTEISPERSQLYAERYRLFSRWQEAFAYFHARLMQVYSVEEMSITMATAIQNEFEDAGILIAIGPVKDIMVLQSLNAFTTNAIDLNDMSSISTRPELDAGLARELATELYELAKKHRSSTKRWLLLREINPGLQSRLSQRFHLAGQGMLAPLLCGDVLCGVMLLTGANLGKSVESTLDHGRFAAMACDVMTTWVRCTAPQLLAGTAADPVGVIPIHSIVSLAVLEQSAGTLQERAGSREILGELAEYSRSINAFSPEIALLADQTCTSLRRVCDADVTMFLRPATMEPNAPYVVEAIDAGMWKWSSYQGLQGTEEQLPFEEKLLKAWPDRFVLEAGKHQRLVHAHNAEEVRITATMLAELEIESLIALPSLIRGHCVAILVAGRKQPGGIADQSLMVATSVASLAGLSLAAMHLMQQGQASQQSSDSAWKMASAMASQTVATLAAVVQKRSSISVTNPQKVAYYAEAIAYQLQLSPSEVSYIRMAALLCDLGMIILPPSIIRKEGGLTGEELRLMQSHPGVSVALLEKLDIIKGALPIILHHHEQYDGKGYPKLLSKDKIPLGSRILTVADTFVNMQLERPYRPAISREDALGLIRQESGKQFDPEMVIALLKVAAQEDKEEWVVDDA